MCPRLSQERLLCDRLLDLESDLRLEKTGSLVRLLDLDEDIEVALEWVLDLPLLLSV